MSALSTTPSPVGPGGEVRSASAVSLPPYTVDAHAGAASSDGSIGSDHRSGSTIRRNPSSIFVLCVVIRVGRTRWVCTSITGDRPANAASAASTSDSASGGTS